MMINKRLIGIVDDSQKYITGNVLVQWFSLLANVVMIFSITNLLQGLYLNTVIPQSFMLVAVIITAAVLIRFACTAAAARMGYLSSRAVKKTLRELIYRKLLRLGASYREQVSTSEVVQVSVEGVDQLETYFGSYLPQFFYSMLAPLTLFFVLSFVNLPAALVLLICVPLIPVSIAAVQTFAKKLLAKYWGQYTTLGDTFLENLQGLTTLKIYQADEYKSNEMNREAEHFRKITMKVLTMQLNSITIMDLIAYGGAALGMIMAVTQYGAGNVSLAGCLTIILLSADFFIPMRQLGSFFHIAMNGMAASDKIFHLLDLPEPERGTAVIRNRYDIVCSDLSYSYEEEREILHGADFHFPQGSFSALVGESGCGKSTAASILMGRNKKYSGSVTLGGVELRDIAEESLMKNVTYISHNSYLFKGTVRENLRMGNPDASDEELWRVLGQMKLADFLREEQGLDTPLMEKGANLSGGQCQRLALARALLHDSPVYIFDEATSNIDVESENHIMDQIHTLAGTKTVLLISHRLANVVGADTIYVLNAGNVAEHGSHEELLEAGGVYAKLWETQQALENYGNQEVENEKAE
ncbi:ABC transporter ATP-binding protein/permease [Lachnospiraceae bacterium ASD4241]|uniref:ABC transporter ATP-binding protein/permease n=2 Tax=Diplocloster modestus TaxID=2850322 RepID=A0ABS6KA76_9FIRM|nr:ABC transporter ATP-binding protein/permease [Diplocloster modestus]MBU9727419.1 ABC transporter ATP-binding protein/permease [Diplocloster modestus]